MPPKKRHTAPTHSLSPLFFSFVLNIFSYSTFVFSAGFIHIYTHKKTKLVFLFFHWISTFAIITDNYKNINNTKSCTYDLFPAKKKESYQIPRYINTFVQFTTIFLVPFFETHIHSPKIPNIFQKTRWKWPQLSFMLSPHWHYNNQTKRNTLLFLCQQKWRLYNY